VCEVIEFIVRACYVCVVDSSCATDGADTCSGSGTLISLTHSWMGWWYKTSQMHYTDTDTSILFFAPVRFLVS